MEEKVRESIFFKALLRWWWRWEKIDDDNTDDEDGEDDEDDEDEEYPEDEEG